MFIIILLIIYEQFFFTFAILIHAVFNQNVWLIYNYVF